MKKLAFVLLFLSTAIAWAAPPNPADYPLKIHVSGSHKNFTTNELTVDAVIGGAKYQLGDTAVAIKDGRFAGVLLPGDYQARIKPRKSTKPFLDIQQYEILFPDNSTAVFDVIGRSE